MGVLIQAVFAIRAVYTRFAHADRQVSLGQLFRERLPRGMRPTAQGRQLVRFAIGGAEAVRAWILLLSGACAVVMSWWRGYSGVVLRFPCVAAMPSDLETLIRQTIRSVPDWPKPGITFRDITPVLQDPRTFRVLIDLFVYRYMRQRLDLVAGVDARGFIVGSVLAYELNLGFVPVRKKGKLPSRTLSEDYSLEYGNATVEIHADAVKTGQRVLLVDDLIATGGTMLAAVKLLQRMGANVVEAAGIIDLPELGGSKAIAATGTPLYTVCQFKEDERA